MTNFLTINNKDLIDHKIMTEEEKVINSQVSGIILSGGAGSRMASLDKGLQLYHGRPLIEHVILSLSQQTSSITLSANRNLQSYTALGFDVVEDQQTDFAGPLAGICSTLTFLLNTDNTAQYAAISSCDTPRLPINFVSHLLANIGDRKVAAVHDGERRQNLHCLICRDAWQDLINYFNAGGRAIWQWQDTLGVSEVDFSDQAKSFSNYNSLEDLKVE